MYSEQNQHPVLSLAGYQDDAAESAAEGCTETETYDEWVTRTKDRAQTYLSDALLAPGDNADEITELRAILNA